MDGELQCSGTENLPSTVGYGRDMHSKECSVRDEMGLRWGKCL